VRRDDGRSIEAVLVQRPLRQQKRCPLASFSKCLSTSQSEGDDCCRSYRIGDPVGSCQALPKALDFVRLLRTIRRRHEQND
jgi:hypothetical protein